MDDHKKSVAESCLAAAEHDAMPFPQIVGILMREGFDGYTIDFRRALATYYMPGGESIELPMRKIDVLIPPAFDTTNVQAAIKEAQQQIPSYTYQSFCRKVASAGCAAYIVSLSGRRALYIGRTAETHVELFPQ